MLNLEMVYRSKHAPVRNEELVEMGLPRWWLTYV